MDGPSEQELEARRKKTRWLIAGGCASLLIPALGALYLQRGEGGPAGPSGRGDVFERRDAGDKRLVPSQAAALPAPAMSPVANPGTASPMPVGGAGMRVEAPAKSSLDFIQPNTEMQQKLADMKSSTAAAGPPPAPAAAAAPAPAAAAKTAPAKKAANGKKAFTMPKLQPTRGFSSNFGGGSRNSGGQAPAAAGGGQQGGGDMQDLLKNLPPGAENNPQLQQYLKGQQK